MEKHWVFIIAVVIFLIINFLYSKILKDFVSEKFGEKWIKVWGNKLYFWQSSVAISSLGTFLIMYILKWFNVLSF